MTEEEIVRMIQSLKGVYLYLTSEVKPELVGHQCDGFNETQDYIKELIDSFRIRLAEGRGE